MRARAHTHVRIHDGHLNLEVKIMDFSLSKFANLVKQDVLLCTVHIVVQTRSVHDVNKVVDNIKVPRVISLSLSL